MGGSCSSDQSVPQNRRVAHGNMRSQNFRNSYPNPRAQRYPPRPQNRYPPQVNRQRIPERPPMMRQPLPQQGRGMIYNQGPPVEQRQYYDRPSQTMGGQSPQIGKGSYPQVMGGRSPQMEAIPQQGLPQIQMPPPQEVIPQPRMVHPPPRITQAQMAPRFKAMPFQAEAPQPPVIFQPPTPTVEQVVSMKPITQETCSMNVTAPQPQSFAFQEEVLSIPKVITAPEPPPCPTNILPPDVYTSPQAPINRSFVQQPRARYQPRFN